MNFSQDASCTAVHAREKKNNRKHCSLHEDYEKIRTELIELFSKKTIFELVQKTNSSELVVI